MQLIHTFTVPVGIDEAFRVLRDVERIAPCMPGATLGDVEGDRFTGKVKVKVGPIQVTYQGEARFTNVDEAKHRATIEANAIQSRGSGTARATITAECRDRGEQTDVTVITDLAITGKPAQFGRSVMNDVGEKLLGQFADCLAHEVAGQEVAGGEQEAAPTAAATPTAASAAGDGLEDGPKPASSGPDAEGRLLDLGRARPSAEAIDLLDVAGAPVLKRLVPVVAAAAVLAIIIWFIRRR